MRIWRLIEGDPESLFAHKHIDRIEGEAIFESGESVVAIDDVIERLEIAINSPNVFIRTARIDQLISDLKESQ